MHLWDRLIDQAIVALNVMWTSTLNNRLSAYAQLHGTFNFSNTPLGPPGTKVVVHEKPGQRGTWSPHGVEGWYIGPAMEHHRSFLVYISSTRTTQNTDTLAWFPSKILMLTASSSDIAMAAAYDLIQALLHPSPASALAPLTDSQRSALYELASIFGHTVTLPSEPRVVPFSDPRVEPVGLNESHVITSPASNYNTAENIFQNVETIDPRVVLRVQPSGIHNSSPNLPQESGTDSIIGHDDTTVVTSNLRNPSPVELSESLNYSSHFTTNDNSAYITNDLSYSN